MSFPLAPRQAAQAGRCREIRGTLASKLNLLETISASPQGLELHLVSLTANVLGAMNGDGDAVAVFEWMKQHPDSPFIPHLSQRIKAAP
jgi:hypothetical protein